MVYDVSQAAYPNLKVSCRCSFISISRQTGQNASMHSFRSNQAYSLRHSKIRPRIRVKRLVPKRFYNNGTNVKSRKDIHRNPTIR